jgi:hypothetical protein
MSPAQMLTRFEPRSDGAQRGGQSLEMSMPFLRDAAHTALAPRGPHRLTIRTEDI